MGVMFSIWSNIVFIQVGGKINKFSFLLWYSRNGKRKYVTHSIITKLFSVLMNKIIFCFNEQLFFFKFWGPFLSSTTDSSPDENGPVFPGLTQLRSGKIAMDYRLRKTYF